MTARRVVHLLGLVCVACAAAGSLAAQPRTPRQHKEAKEQHFDALIADAKQTMLGNPKEVIGKTLIAEHYVDGERDPRTRAMMKATAQWLRGEAFIRMNDVDSAAPLIAAALKTVARLAPDSKLHADLLLSSGDINRIRVKAAKALSDFHQAYVIFHRLNDPRSQAKALYFLANLYLDGKDNENALKYLDQAIAVFKSDPGSLISLYNNRGNVLDKMGRFDDAERQYRDALRVAQRMKSPLLTALVLYNLAEAELGAHRVDLADQSIDAAMRLTGSGEATGFHTQILALAAQSAYQHHNLVKAARLLAQRFAGVDLDHTTVIDREAHHTAYQVYQALGRDDLAVRHLAALKRLDDQATDLARSTNAALMGARFDFANQELKIAKLRQDELARNVAFERARARTQRLIFLGASGAALIIMAMLLYALRTSRRSRERVQVANDDLAVTNDALGKALAAKTEFLATTSHEIRTPLNGILGMTQVMLIDDTLGVSTRERLKVVHEAGATMRALVDDILDVAKMETGNLTIEAASFDLKAMMIESTCLWTVQAEAKNLSFIRMLDDCPRWICGDAVRVRQIVFNLLANALKFTTAGSISLTVAAAGDRYRIAVSDSGVGIPADKREAIFESFRQADTSTTRKFGGTGLGLSICRKLARAMGGDVAVESVAGEGATFIVDLPLVPTDAIDAEACTAHRAADLLIVDRNPITRNMLKALFAPHLATIEVVPSISDAIERVRAGGVGHVLADDATVRLGDPLPDLTVLAGAGDAAVTLLWPVSAEAEADELRATGIDLLVAKPVTGAALVDALLATFPSRYDQPLESHAA